MENIELSVAGALNVVPGPTRVARMCVDSFTEETLAFVPVDVTEIVGRRANGPEVGNAYGTPGEVVMVSHRRLLEAYPGADTAHLRLVIYGIPGLDYRPEATDDLRPPNNLARPGRAPSFGLRGLDRGSHAGRAIPVLAIT